MKNKIYANRHASRRAYILKIDPSYGTGIKEKSINEVDIGTIGALYRAKRSIKWIADDQRTSEKVVIMALRKLAQEREKIQMTEEEIKKRLKEIEDELFYTEMNDHLSRQDYDYMSELRKEAQTLEKQLNLLKG